MNTGSLRSRSWRVTLRVRYVGAPEGSTPWRKAVEVRAESSGGAAVAAAHYLDTEVYELSHVESVTRI